MLCVQSERAPSVTRRSLVQHCCLVPPINLQSERVPSVTWRRPGGIQEATMASLDQTHSCSVTSTRIFQCGRVPSETMCRAVRFHKVKLGSSRCSTFPSAACNPQESTPPSNCVAEPEIADPYFSQAETHEKIRVA